ncbi:ABC transporter B family member 5, partial [Dictyocoela roeselum]
MNRMKSDQFVLYLSISRILASNLDKLGYMYARFTQAMTNAKMTYMPPHPPEKEYSISSFTDNIRYENVSFSYNGHQVFENVSFKINYGDKVAIIGRNGVGKSTLLKMLLKFNEYSGSIKLDGKELKYVSKRSLRNLISYVPQEGLMINESVRFNLKYGNPHLDDFQIINTCSRMGINKSITKLENGYNTIVGPRGSKLSGGERQKICVMRALFKDSDIMIMDEPTANIDVEAESELLRNFFLHYSE